MRFDKARHTPKVCACRAAERMMNETGRITLGKNPEEDSCECCLHQRRVGLWKEEYCKDRCVRTRYPLWVWGLWELAMLVMQPVGVGMGGAIWIVNDDAFHRYTKAIGISLDDDLEDFLFVRQLVQYILSSFDGQSDSAWDDSDFKDLEEESLNGLS